MILSTFASDLVLCLVSFFVAYKFVGFSSIPTRAALYGFTIIAISAGLGSIHFLGINSLDLVYRFFVGLSGCVGVPLLGLAFFHLGIKPLSEKLFYIKILSMFVAFLLFVYYYPIALYPTVVGGISMAIIILVGILRLKNHNTAALFAICGAVLFILAGLVIGTSGKTGPILNVDIFHTLLAIANFALGKSILKMR
jgi:hypothetical protein